MSIRQRELFCPGEAIVIAVSGGVDSMVLLNVLNELAPSFGWALVIVHLNHQLRGRLSRADERFVRSVAEDLRLPFHTNRVDVRGLAKQRGVSLEMAGRELRHEYLARIACERGARKIALAHHADDQVELFFLRLLRGSGSEGLAGMRWKSVSPANHEIQLVRPLLDVPKSVLLQDARRNKLKYCQDHTNNSLSIPRNRIRNQLLPQLRKSFQPALQITILRTMEILSGEFDFLNECAADWLTHQGFDKFSALSPAAQGRRANHVVANPVVAQTFAGLPLAVQRRALHLQLIRLGLQPEFELVEQLRRFPGVPVCVRKSEHLLLTADAQCHHGLGSEQPRSNQRERIESARGPVLASRDNQGLIRLRLVEELSFNPASKWVEFNQGQSNLVFGGLRLSWKVKLWKSPRSIPRKPGQELFDADRVGSGFLVRHWQAGDKFQPIGMNSEVKLQDLFTNQKVSQPDRHRVVLAASARGEVFWVEGMRISERFKLTRHTNRCLQWAWRRV